MSNLFFSFDLTPSLLAETPVPDKAALLNDNATQADAFDALLREQMGEGPLSGLNEHAPTSPNERFAAEASAPETPGTIAIAPNETTAAEPVTPPTTTVSPNTTNAEAGENEFVSNEVADGETAALPTPLPLRETADDSADDSAAAVRPTLQTAAKPESTTATTVPQPLRQQWHFDRHQPRETNAASLAVLASGQPDPQRNARLTTIRDLVGNPPTALPQETRQDSAFEATTITVANEPIAAAAVASAAFAQSANLNVLPIEFVQAKTPTQPINETASEVTEVTPLSSREADEVQSETSLPVNVPLPLNQAASVPATKPSPPVRDEAGQNTDQVEQTPALPAPVPQSVETAPTTISSVQVPVLNTTDNIVPAALLEPLTQNNQAPLAATNDQPKPTTVAPNAVSATVRELSAQPASVTLTTSTANATVDKASHTPHSVGQEPVRSNNPNKAANPELSVAPPNSTEHGRWERSTNSENPLATPSAKPAFFTAAQPAYEQRAIAPDNTVELLTEAGVGNVLVEVVPASSSPAITPNFAVLSSATPAPQEQTNVTNVVEQPELLLAQSLQSNVVNGRPFGFQVQPDLLPIQSSPLDNAGNNAEPNNSTRPSNRPAAPINTLTELLEPLSDAPPPEQPVIVAETVVKSVSSERDVINVRDAAPTEISEVAEESESFNKPGDLNFNRAVVQLVSDDVVELQQPIHAAPLLQPDEPRQAAAKATPVLVPLVDSIAATAPAEIPNKPLTVGQVVRTVLKNDAPFMPSTLPSTLPTTNTPPLVAGPATPELVAPQAQPITVDLAVPPVAPDATPLNIPAPTQLNVPAATQLNAPAATQLNAPTVLSATQLNVPAVIPAAASSQPASTNNLVAAEVEQTVKAESKQPITASAVPVTTTEPQTTEPIKTPVSNAQPTAVANTEADITAVIAKSPTPAAVSAIEQNVPPTSPNVLSAAPRGTIASGLNGNLTLPTPALPVADKELEGIQHNASTTVPTQRLGRPEQRTFQLMLELPSTASSQVQTAFARELSNPVAALNRPTLQTTDPAPTPLPITIAPVGPSIQPTDIVEANALAPQVQSLSETLSGPLNVVRNTQVVSRLDHCEVAPLAPHLVAEPLRTTFAAIERRFANVVPATPNQPAVAWPPTPTVNSTVAAVESIKPDFQQADTQRELVLPPSLQTDLAAFETSPLATLTPAPSARATVSRVFMTPATAVPAKATTDLTDEWLGEWLGERQITDPPVSSTEAESVGTLTPNPPASAPDATPEATLPPESASPATYFSTNVTHAAWATNLVTESLPVVWNPLKPSVHSAGTARWTAALNHVAGPASHSTAHEAAKVNFPWVALNTPLAQAPTVTDKASKPERPNAPSVDAASARPLATSIEASVEAASTRPFERVVSPPPGLIGRSSLPGATSELAMPRVALEHERAIDHPLPPEPLEQFSIEPTVGSNRLAQRVGQVANLPHTPPPYTQTQTDLATRTAQSGVEAVLPTMDAHTTPTANGTELDLQPAGRKAVQEDKEGLAFKSLDAAAPFPLEHRLERGTAVAQSADTRDTHVSHVARQLAEPLMTASAGLALNEPRTIRLKLRPETLGEVEIVLTHDTAGQYHARMITEREQTTHVLRGQLGQLREALEQAGLQVGQLDITTSAGSPEHHRQGGQGWHAGGQDSQHAHAPAPRIPEIESFDHEPDTYSGSITAHNGLLNLHA